MGILPCHSSYLEGNVIPPTKKLSLCFGRGVDQMIFLFLFYIVTGGVGDVMGGDAPEEAVYVVPLVQELSGAPATGLFLVPLNDGTQGFDLIWGVEAVEAYEFGVAAHGEDACDIQYVGDASRHTSSEVGTGFAENDDHATGHVFTGMGADSLHDSQSPTVTHGKTLSRTSGGKELTAGCTVEDGITEDSVGMIGEAGIGWGGNDNLPPGHTFTDVIVSFAMEYQAQARETEGTKALTC